MVEMIVALTTGAVMVLAALNALHAGLVIVRLARQIAARHADLGLRLWLPVFGSLADVHTWVGAWRAVLGSRDPALAAIRADARIVVTRYLHLALTSQSWAMAVWALAPHLA